MITFNRQELYEMVWNNTFTALSKKYNISDVGLRKACVRMGIPLPDVGYWSKVKAGKNVRVKPLPQDHEGVQEIKLRLRSLSGAVDEYEISEQLTLSRTIAQEHGVDSRIPRKLMKPDPLITQLEQAFREKKFYHSNDLMCFRGDGLQVDVSLCAMQRALRFLNAFVKIMRKRGHDFLVEYRKRVLKIGAHRFEMKLTEMTQKTSQRNKEGDVNYQATGKFYLYFQHWGSAVSCKDGKQPIEEKMPSIIAKLELLAKKSEEQHLYYEKQRAEVEKAARKREELEKRKALELEAVRYLLLDEQRWRAATALRQYLGYVEQRAMKEDVVTEDLTLWLARARKKADWLDPVVRGSDEWLTDEDLEVVSVPRKEPEFVTDVVSDQTKPERNAVWPCIPWYIRR